MTNAPFNKSKMKAKIPYLKPRTRMAFVAPVFFDPNCLISTFLKTFPIINPLGMDPRKYESTINKKIYTYVIKSPRYLIIIS